MSGDQGSVRTGRCPRPHQGARLGPAGYQPPEPAVHAFGWPRAATGRVRRQVLPRHLGQLPRLDSVVRRKGVPASDQLFHERSRTPEAGACRSRAGRFVGPGVCIRRGWHAGVALPGATPRHRAGDFRACALAHFLDQVNRLPIARRQAVLRSRRQRLRQRANRGLQGQIEQDLVPQGDGYTLAAARRPGRTRNPPANSPRRRWRHGDVAAFRQPGRVGR